jgi:type IV pilus assembly protein PilN
MKDLNFFLPYLESKKELKSNYNIIIILFTAVGLYILVSSGWYFYNSYTINKDINSINAELNNSALSEKYKEAELFNNKFNLLNKYSDAAANLIKGYETKDVVSTTSISQVLSCLPQDVFISSISMNESSVQLQCTSKSIVTAAEFEHNLIKLDKFKEVTISGIAGDATKGTYGFSINCTVKGVDSNENKQK